MLFNGAAVEARDPGDVERKHRAAGRSRVARDSIDVVAIQTQEAEHTAMAEGALRRFESA